MNTKQVGTNPFVLRQTPDSPFSHFGGSWEELEALVEANMGNAVPGATAGSLTVKVNSAGFFASVVKLTPDTPLRAFFATRQRALDGEQPFVHVVATAGEKVAAVVTEVIVYEIGALSVEERRHTDGRIEETPFQIVSINCRATEGPEPPTPSAMARNMAAYLGRPEGVGGTPTEYTGQQFMEAILYWQCRALFEPSVK